MSAFNANRSNATSKSSKLDQKGRLLALAQLQEMFRDSLDPEVVHLILTESDFNVDNALDTLFALSQDTTKQASSSAVGKMNIFNSNASVGKMNTLDNFTDGHQPIYLQEKQDTASPVVNSPASNPKPTTKPRERPACTYSYIPGQVAPSQHLKQPLTKNIGTQPVEMGSTNGKEVFLKHLHYDGWSKAENSNCESQDKENFSSQITGASMPIHVGPVEPSVQGHGRKKGDVLAPVNMSASEASVLEGIYTAEQLEASTSTFPQSSLASKAMPSFNDLLKQVISDGASAEEWKEVKKNERQTECSHFEIQAISTPLISRGCSQEREISTANGTMALENKEPNDRPNRSAENPTKQQTNSRDSPHQLPPWPDSNQYPRHDKNMMPSSHTLQNPNPSTHSLRQPYMDPARMYYSPYPRPSGPNIRPWPGLPGPNVGRAGGLPGSNIRPFIPPPGWGHVGPRGPPNGWYMNQGPYRAGAGLIHDIPGSKQASCLQPVQDQIPLGQLHGKHKGIPQGKVLFLMRGLPGSGKSTLAMKLKAGGVVYSTDDFFLKNGCYQFDNTRVGEAHEWNQIRARESMEKGVSPVVIDNTNTQSWELRPYVSMAQRLGYKVALMEPDMPWKWKPRELARRNNHGVSLDRIQIMLERYEHNLTVEKILNNRKEKTETKTLKEANTDNHGKNITGTGQHKVLSESNAPSNMPTSKHTHPKEKGTGKPPGFENWKNGERALNLRNNTSCSNAKQEIMSVPNMNGIADQQQMKYESSFQPATTSNRKDVHPKKHNEYKKVISTPPKNANAKKSQRESASRNKVIERREGNPRKKEHSHGSRSPITFLEQAEFLNAAVVSRDDQEHDKTQTSESDSISGSSQPRPQRAPRTRRRRVIDEEITDGRDVSTGHEDESCLNPGCIEPTDDGDIDAEKKLRSLQMQLTKSSDSESTSVLSNDESTRPEDNDGDNESSPRPKEQRIGKRRPTRGGVSSMGNLDDVANMADSTDGEDRTEYQQSSVVDLDVSVDISEKKQDNCGPALTEDSSTLPSIATANTVPASLLDNDVLLESDGATSPDVFVEEECSSSVTDDVGDDIDDDDVVVEQEETEQKETKGVLVEDEAISQSNETSDVSEDIVESSDELYDSDVSGNADDSGSTMSDVMTKEELNHGAVLQYSTPFQDNDPFQVCLKELYSKEQQPGDNSVDGASDELQPPPINDEELCGLTGVHSVNPHPLSQITESVMQIQMNTNQVPPVKSQCTDKAGRKYVDLSKRRIKGVDYSTGLVSYEDTTTSSSDESGQDPENGNDSLETASLLRAEVMAQEQEELQLEGTTSEEDTTSKLTGFEFLATCFPDIDEHIIQDTLSNNDGDVNKAVQEMLMVMETDELPLTSKYVKYTENEASSRAVEPATSLNISVKDLFTLRTSGVPTFPDAQAFVGYQGIMLPPATDSVVIPGASDQFQEAKGTLGDDTPMQGSAQYQQDHMTFQLTLEPAVAFHLVEMFGPIDGVNLDGDVTPDDMVVNVTPRFANSLYSEWKKSAQKRKGLVPAGKDNKDVTDGALHSLQSPLSSTYCASGKQTKRQKRVPLDLQNDSPTASPPTTRSVTNLREIMDEQLAVEQSRSDQDKRDSDTNMAVVLKRQKLYAMFPGVDPLALEELFQANGYELAPTVVMVQASCNLQARPTTVINPAVGSDGAQEDWSWLCLDDEPGISGLRFQATDDPEYTDFRAEAAIHYQLRDECFKKAALAFSKKQGQLAQFYASQGRTHTEKINQANARAAARILEYKNADHNQYTIDLHGLHVHEAIQALEEKLNPTDPSKRRPKYISVVTGRGIHSKGGRAKIKPAVVEYLQQNNYQYEELHPGLVRVYLK